MIEMLDALVDDIVSLNNKLVILIGPPRSGKSRLLNQLSARRQVPVLNIGATLSRELLLIPSTRRHLHAPDVVKALVDQFSSNGLLLIDNIEILFDRTLLISPLDMLKRHARALRVIAVWPGEFWGDRLSYAATGHPEHQDYAIEGLVPFEIY